MRAQNWRRARPAVPASAAAHSARSCCRSPSGVQRASRCLLPQWLVLPNHRPTDLPSRLWIPRLPMIGYPCLNHFGGVTAPVVGERVRHTSAAHPSTSQALCAPASGKLTNSQLSAAPDMRQVTGWRSGCTGCCAWTQLSICRRHPRGCQPPQSAACGAPAALHRS